MCCAGAGDREFGQWKAGELVFLESEAARKCRRKAESRKVVRAARSLPPIPGPGEDPGLASDSESESSSEVEAERRSGREMRVFSPQDLDAIQTT